MAGRCCIRGWSATWLPVLALGLLGVVLLRAKFPCTPPLISSKSFKTFKSAKARAVASALSHTPAGNKANSKPGRLPVVNTAYSPEMIVPPPPASIRFAGQSRDPGQGSLSAAVLKTMEKSMVEPHHHASAQRAVDWLVRHQRPNGLYQYGWIPALHQSLPGQHLLRQAGTAAAVARWSTLQKDANASQSARRCWNHVWNLSFHDASTTADKDGSNTDAHPDLGLVPRPHRTEPHPAGLAALLLWGCSEMPSADQSDRQRAQQLVHFLLARQRADGSFNVSETGHPEADDPPQASLFYPGEILFALARSSRHDCPLDLDLALRQHMTEALRRAFAYYKASWADRPDLAWVPWQIQAWAELALRFPNEPKYHDFVFELADWVLQLQYGPTEDVPNAWKGGFAQYQAGHALMTPPEISTASQLEGLAGAVAVARARGEHARAKQYQQAWNLGTQFLARLQYAERAPGHYQPKAWLHLAGGFRAGLDDGRLRLDFAQHALSALTPAWDNRSTPKKSAMIAPPSASESIAPGFTVPAKPGLLR